MGQCGGGGVRRRGPHARVAGRWAPGDARRGNDGCCGAGRRMGVAEGAPRGERGGRRGDLLQGASQSGDVAEGEHVRGPQGQRQIFGAADVVTDNDVNARRQGLVHHQSPSFAIIARQHQAVGSGKRARDFGLIQKARHCAAGIARRIQAGANRISEGAVAGEQQVDWPAREHRCQARRGEQVRRMFLGDHFATEEHDERVRGDRPLRAPALAIHAGGGRRRRETVVVDAVRRAGEPGGRHAMTDVEAPVCGADAEKAIHAGEQPAEDQALRKTAPLRLGREVVALAAEPDGNSRGLRGGGGVPQRLETPALDPERGQHPRPGIPRANCA